MPRYALRLCYHGGRFVGWQRQPNGVSVQGELERCLSAQLKTPIAVHGCGRTDSGVHARDFIAHFDYDGAFTPDHRRMLEKFLPNDISVLKAYDVEPAFNARFDCSWREYKYFISLGKSVFASDRTLRFSWFLDPEPMKQAAECLAGEHDFTTFSKSKSEVKHHRCTVLKAEWGNHRGKLVFTIRANRFVRGMVRALTGAMIDVGKGKISPQQFKDALAAQDRTLASSLAAPHGLVLWKVHYPPDLLKEQDEF